MYVILTSKPTQYRTYPGADMTPIEVYDYLDSGRLVATFVIASFERETRVEIVDESTPSAVNRVPTRLLEKFETAAAAAKALRELAQGGRSHAQLVRRQDTTVISTR
ncbi:hypothetical protein [Paraburkholderia acidipaludis]|uniref:hypothetical protein n=1 Tax=Paraburkholderia acidipaludis TaxID=660537 RepID=UPI00047FEE85|nr:hypothetical protein [Paraburkholderia acidipaludis]